MTANEILQAIDTNGQFWDTPARWAEIDTQSALDELIKSGVIEKLSKSQPREFNAEYIYVRRA